MEKYVCECCGGQIDRVKMQCKYCGTQYKENYDRPIRIETFTNPVRTFSACVEVESKENAEYAIKALANELSKVIPSVMEVRAEYDPSRMINRVYGRIKVIQPVNVSDI